MKIKCGTDIIEIKRIKESIETLGDKFIKRVFTKEEIEYCEGKKNQKYQHYAARFAAKEATFKAVSYQLNDKYTVKWTDFETINDAEGRPRINIYNEKIKIRDIDVSISHSKEFAIANVVILD